MNCLEVTQRKQKLDNMFKSIASLNYDAELEAHWTRYLCVLTAGFIEASIRAIYGLYAQNKAQITSRFVQTNLKGFQNAKMQKIVELTGAFNDDWRKDLEQSTQGQLKESIDSIIANRHLIAHGRDVTITFTSLQAYYKDAVRVIELIDAQCSKRP